MKKKFSDLYSSVTFFFKKGLVTLIKKDPETTIEEEFSEYQKFKLGLKSVFNVWEILEEMKKMKNALRGIIKREKKLKNEIDEFQKLANDDQFKSLMGMDFKKKGDVSNKLFEENLEYLSAFRQIFNQETFENILIVLQSFINDVNNLILKIDNEENFQKCRDSLENFCFCYAPLTRRLRGYCQCLINGAI